MNDTTKKTDLELKDNVITKLKYEPIEKVVDISVLFNNGMVILK